jgi:hypothetical protein
LKAVKLSFLPGAKRGIFVAMKGEIKLLDALNLMDDVDRNGQPLEFGLKYVKYSRQNGTGGDIKEVKRATKAERPGSKGSAKQKQRKAAAQASEQANRKDPQHKLNETKNIYDLDAKQVRKFNIRLLIEFNEQKVVY